MVFSYLLYFSNMYMSEANCPIFLTTSQSSTLLGHFLGPEECGNFSEACDDLLFQLYISPIANIYYVRSRTPLHLFFFFFSFGANLKEKNLTLDLTLYPFPNQVGFT